MIRKGKEKEPTLTELAFQALKEAVAGVLAEHKRMGLPIAVWRDGKVIHISPERIAVRDTTAPYGSSNPGDR